ncbi:uncharacterized protein LOC129314383 [Prosopis cineraria]|uniref:uncharacterized protein LOC129314383 n=1 Tax=Prosopis cineraria TaxID=364024 RepID=UPI00240EA167|nr:uncharacterized protein LOC129314383 [Prosopis cineraria]
MTTLVRNGTMTFSRRYRYEPLGLKSVSYRRRRAKQRQIFLTTYRLSSFSQDFPADSKLTSSSSSSPPKLKKVAVKVKKMVTSVLVFMRTGSFRSCNSKSAISATSPASSNTKTFWP